MDREMSLPYTARNMFIITCRMQECGESGGGG